MKNSSPSSPHFPWLDVSKGIAILGVVLVHLTAPYLLAWSGQLTSQWLTANLLNSPGRMGVPLFFIVSGYLLLNRGKTDSPLHFYLRRWHKIGWWWLFWGSLHLCYQLVKGSVSWQWEWYSLFKTLYLTFVTGFWFVPQLLVVYLIAPYLDRWLKRRRPSDVWLLALGCLLIGSVLTHYVLWSYREPWIPFVHLFTYIGLFLTGALLRESARKNLGLPMIGWIFFYLVTVVGTTIVSHSRQGFSAVFYEYGAFNVVGMSVCFFRLIQTLSQDFRARKGNQMVLTTLTFLGKNSYQLFLSHTLILMILAEVFPLWSNELGVWLIPGIILKLTVVIGLSLITTKSLEWSLRKSVNYFSFLNRNQVR